MRTGPVRWAGWGALLMWAVGWLLRGGAAALVWTVCRPRVAGAALVASGVAVLVASMPVTVLLLVTVAAHVGYGWSVLDPSSFRRRVALRALGWWRSVWVYRRHWSAAMTVAELVGRDGSLPRLVGVRCTDEHDVVRVRAVLGQRGRQWEDAAPMAAHVFGATSVELRRGDDRRLLLVLGRGARGRAWDREEAGGRVDG